MYRQRRWVGLGRAGGVDLGWVEVGPNGALVVSGWGVVAKALGMPVHTDTHISKHTPRKRRTRGTTMDESGVALVLMWGGWEWLDVGKPTFWRCQAVPCANQPMQERQLNQYTLVWCGR